jgi:uncharacterized repeat protein (TIGR01451 family)
LLSKKHLKMLIDVLNNEIYDYIGQLKIFDFERRESMRKISNKQRFLAVVLSVLMVALGLPLQAQAASSNWSQLANKTGDIDWIYGNLNSSKSVYVEGMSVPQRLIINDIKPIEGKHYVEFEHQFTKGGYYAYDFITGWDQAKDAAQDYIGQNWDDDWIGELQHSVDIAVPSNTHSSDQENAYEDIYGERTIRLYSSEPVTKTAITITMNNTLQGDVDGDSSLGFKVSWEGDAKDVVILYASHIAIGDNSEMGWGAGKGAGGISGSPYHNYLASSSEWEGKSSKDNQLSIDYDVVNISGIKWGDKDGDGIKDTSEDGLKGWEIWADLNKNGALDSSEPSASTGSNGRYSLNVMLADKNNNNVRVYETQKSGFTQTYPGDEIYHEFILKQGDADISDVNFGNFEILPSITVTKVASPTSRPIGGGEFTYNFVVTNNGEVPVTLTSVYDSDIHDITLPADVRLEPGESTEEMTATWTHTESGTHTNTVTAIATSVYDINKVAKATASASVNVSNDYASIIVTKTPYPLALPEPGGEFTFTYVITNNGTEVVTLTGVDDDKIGPISLDGVNTIINPGASVTLTGMKTYTDNGTYVNKVTVNALYGGYKTLTAEATASVTVTDTKPLISVTKTASPTSMTVPGGEFTYTFVVKNIGTVPVTLTSVSDKLYDDKVIKEITLPKIVDLLPGETSAEMVITATHTAVGTYRNTVTATAVDDDGNPATSTADAFVKVTEEFIPRYELAITKEADVEEYDAVNDVINYTIKVSNKGNSALTNVDVTDSLLKEALSGPTGDANENEALDTDEIWVYKGAYSVTQADITRGFITNIAKADSKETEPETGSVTVDYDEPGGPTDNSRYRITIEKDADVREYSAEGDVINYTITLNNNGNRVLTGIKVTDPLLKTLDGPEGDSDNDKKLDLNETWIYTGSYTVTEADMLEDSIENTATADTNETGPVDDTVIVNRNEEEIIIPEPEVPEAGVPEIPEEIEEQPVPQGTLPNTGRFFNTSILAALGSILVISGLALNKKKRIKE